MEQPPQPKPESPAARPPAGQPARIGGVSFSVAQFLIALVLMFVGAPLVELVPGGNLIEALLMTLVLVSGVLAVGRSHRTLALAVVLAAPAVAGRWLNHLRPDLVPAEAFLAPGLVFVIFVVVNLLRFILRAPRVDSEVLCAGLCTYLLLGLLWSFAYILVAHLSPGAFAFTVSSSTHDSIIGFRALYFSLITLTTVGYGDIVPISNVARMLAAMEAMTGTLFVAVFISRLVALYSTQPVSAEAGGAKETKP